MQYTFTGASPHILSGLILDVNATVTRDGQPVEGSGTVVGYPGDVITTDDPYVSALLTADTPPVAPPEAPDETLADLEAQAIEQAKAEYAVEHPSTPDAPSDTTSNGVNA